VNPAAADFVPPPMLHTLLPRRIGVVLAIVGIAIGLSACDTTVSIVPMASCTTGTLFCYKPASVSVASGTKVIFKNTTTVVHTVTRCSTPACPVSGGTGKDTGFGSATTIAAGGSYSFTFHGKGTYVYYCQIHGYAVMHGTITVT
jgi:plastocyanin